MSGFIAEMDAVVVKLSVCDQTATHDCDLFIFFLEARHGFSCL